MRIIIIIFLQPIACISWYEETTWTTTNNKRWQLQNLNDPTIWTLNVSINFLNEHNIVFDGLHKSHTHARLPCADIGIRIACVHSIKRSCKTATTIQLMVPFEYQIYQLNYLPLFNFKQHSSIPNDCVGSFARFSISHFCIAFYIYPIYICAGAYCVVYEWVCLYVAAAMN